MNSGDVQQESVTVTNTGTANLIISNVNSSNVYFTTDPGISMIAPGDSQKFYITFAPLIPGYEEGYIYFNHNALNEIDSVHINGTGVGNDIAPKFSVSPSSLDFGTVFIGNSKRKSVVVTNTGNVGSRDLIISNVNISNSHYSITPTIATIERGSSMEFFITFEPTIEGQVNANIQFLHNAGKDTIDVTGIGLPNLDIITIKEARDLPIGSDFVIEGIVTRALGNYTRLQDETAGLTILQESGLFFNDVANFDIQIGDKIRVHGRISEDNYLKVINGNDLTGFQRLSRLNVLPIPVKVTLSELRDHGEKYESRLITLDNLTITDDSDYSKSVVIRIGNHMDTEIDGMPFLEGLVTFEGVLSQFSTNDPAWGYQLTPVLPLDLRNTPVDVFERVEANTFALSECYPNPFTSFTTIKYNIAKSGFTTLQVYNIYGDKVATLVEGYREAGLHSVTFYVSGERLSLSSGVYYYRLQSGSSVSIKQMVFVK